MELKLGKKPARKGAVTFRFTRFFDPTRFPKPPAAFGRYSLIRSCGLLGNQRFGCCVFAGFAHETMMIEREQKRLIRFNERAVLSDYSAVTGFNRRDPNTDQGTDMTEAASYRRKTGIIDANGKRHPIWSFIGLTLDNINQLKLAMWLFPGAGIGLQWPDTAMDQFERREPLDVKARAKNEGGHYVSGVGWKPNGNIVYSSWGRGDQEMTQRFYGKYADEVSIYLTRARLSTQTQLTPENFDLATLEADLEALRK